MDMFVRNVFQFCCSMVVGYLLLLGLLTIFQNFLIFHPDNKISDPKNAEIPGLSIVQLHTDDYLSLRAWYLPASEGKPTIIYFHGNAGGLENRISRMQTFHMMGFGMLFVEYRGYGGNPGRPSETGLIQDAKAGMDFLQAQHVPLQHIVVYGESLGTGIATQMAASYPVGGLVLEAPYTSLVDVAAYHYPWIPMHWLMRTRLDLLKSLASVHAPIFIMRGMQDTIVPPWMGQAVFDAASSPKRLCTAPFAGHQDMWFTNCRHDTIKFIEQVIGNSGQTLK
jgi:uncharacterized protein